jgi:hypothetical protein
MIWNSQSILDVCFPDMPNCATGEEYLTGISAKGHQQLLDWIGS